MKFKKILPVAGLVLFTGALISGIISYTVILRKENSRISGSQTHEQFIKYNNQNIENLINNSSLFSLSLKEKYMSILNSIKLGDTDHLSQTPEQRFKSLLNIVKLLISLKNQAQQIVLKSSQQLQETYNQQIINADLNQIEQIIQELKSKQEN
ncbi:MULTISPECIES: hypothetical protein [unclassified Mycoplasma]|uniref:hypothetical protein n=1 Tax=unclassified Mycoplasma TaxID=2683645 RepID=UPI00211B96AA|nr:MULTISPECIES: hypothetical protein [unclassified Mycoplasma]UUM19996.1 hypothetical protein NPA11_00975 [Mycoplasma sp. 1578d]UUM24977.1 hypothetical protein NPA12_00960 [Mycoplasma sp. 3686d]